MLKEAKKRRVGAWPLKKFFEGLHPDYKKLLARKLRDITTHCTFQLTDKIPSLEECFTILGMCETRIYLIREVEDAVKSYSGTWMRSIQEVSDLKEQCQKQAELIKKMIRGHLQQLSKESANGLRDSD